MTAESEARTTDLSGSYPLELVLCAVDDALARAWEAQTQGRPGVRVHHGSTLEVPAHAVVSPTNSFGRMRGGIDAVYAETFPNVEQNVRSGVLAFHGGELPVGEALIVPTGVPAPAWLISAPTMRRPGELLPADTVHPYLAARGVFRLWLSGRLDEGVPIRQVVHSIALPGLGTGYGGVAPTACARQVMAAWDEVFSQR